MTKATIEVEARPLHALYILGLVVRVAGATELPLVGGVNDHADYIRRLPGLSPMGPVHATVGLRIILVLLPAAGFACTPDSIVLEVLKGDIMAHACGTYGMLSDPPELEGRTPSLWPICG